jgi:hypothetical protein
VQCNCAWQKGFAGRKCIKDSHPRDLAGRYSRETNEHDRNAETNAYLGNRMFSRRCSRQRGAPRTLYYIYIVGGCEGAVDDQVR